MTSHLHVRALLVSHLLGASVSVAQIPGGNALVLTVNATPGVASKLLDVDMTTGAIHHLGAFPSDGLPGLAVTIDPVQGDAIVALAAGPATIIVRVSLNGGVAGTETPLGVVPGIVTDIGVAWNGEVYCTTGGPTGAVYELPRTGGQATFVVPAPFATAIGNANMGSGVLMIGLSGPPAMVLVDVFTHQTISGPFPFAGQPNPGITGLAFRPFGDEMFTDDGGRVWHTILPVTVLPYQAAPLPAGGLRALGRDAMLRLVGLGGVAHPYLKTLQDAPTLVQSWIVRAGPLPGDPVDFALQLRVPNSFSFGVACAAGALPPALLLSGQPQLGSAGFTIGLANGQPATLAVLVLGMSDQVALGSAPLPISLPGACQLLVSPDVALLHVTDASGAAQQVWPLPPSPWLSGLVVFAQWIVVPPSFLLSTTYGASLHLGL